MADRRTTRVSSRKHPKQARSNALVAAVLDAAVQVLTAEGARRFTAARVAERAGVTPGLIRHYFVSKELMFQAAYRAVMMTMFETADQAAEAASASPIDRLRVFLLANFQAPIIDPRNLSLWATFISQISVDPALAAIHREGYLSFRNSLEALLADFFTERSVDASPERCRHLAIAINGLLDGLWLEGCLAGELFGESELVDIALTSIETLLGLRFKPVDATRADG